MKLKYIAPPESEGGSAVPGCGTIHISEIRPTLTKLSDDLDFPFDLNDYVLGSTGKKEYSGDIDLVLDDKWWGHGVPALREDLENIFGKHVVARNGSMLHLKYLIEGYNPKLNEHGPRTGYVQIDFNLGDTDWEKFYHYSPGDDSEYKGAHRNLAIAAICAVADVQNSKAVDGYDRPVEQFRWKFGQNGFIHVRRESTKDERSGVWNRKQVDTVLEDPIKDPIRIAQILFPVDGVPADLHSLETIMAAVERNYGMTDQQRIWKRMASNFHDWKDGRNFIYPTEITKYFSLDDK
jgi:hypothetical protein